MSPIVNATQRLYDAECILRGSAHAIERARSRGDELIGPDDLMAGLLLAVARFGIVDLGSVAIDLEALGLRFDLPPPDVRVKPRYADGTVAVFERAARVARGDGAAAMAPVHLLVAMADPSIPTFACIAARYGLDAAAWRRALAGVEAPVPADGGVRAAAAPPPPGAAPQALGGLLTTDEAAALLGVHVQTLRTYIRSGKLPALRVAGERAIRIRRDDLLGLLRHLDGRRSEAENT